jgi:miniconductance mechanosensitive channel
VEHFKNFLLLRDYIADKQQDLGAYNADLSAEYSGVEDNDANLRRLTNLGTFRAYIYAYLQHRQDIHEGMTLLVRQLPSGPQGVPIEVYCFTNTTDWGRYEGIQGDIFDHLLAIVGEFGLRLYQQPAGADLAGLSRTTAEGSYTTAEGSNTTAEGSNTTAEGSTTSR